MNLIDYINEDEITDLLSRFTLISGTSLWAKDHTGKVVSSTGALSSCPSEQGREINYNDKCLGRIEANGGEHWEEVIDLVAEEIFERFRSRVEMQGMAQHVSENYQELNCLFDIIQHLPSLIGYDVTENCEIILKATGKLIGASRSCLLISNEEQDELTLLDIELEGEVKKSSYIFSKEKIGPWEYTYKTGHAINAANLKDLPADVQRFDDHGHSLPLLSYRLEADEKPLGVFCFCGKTGIDFFSSTEVKLIKVIAAHTASLLSNHQLVKNARNLFMGAISALANAIESKDSYTFGHVERVTKYSTEIAEKLGMSEERIERLKIAAMMHDLGKIGTPDQILLKEGKLNSEERAIMETHTLLGPKILKGFKQLEPIIPWIQSHHERPDGKGYPLGLQGDEIPLESQIIGAADAFDAMTTNRSYRTALPYKEAQNRLKEGAGTQFNENILNAFYKTAIFKNLIKSEE